MIFENYYRISHHPFVQDVLKRAVEISREIQKPNGFKLEIENEREPLEEEYYVLQLGYCLSQLLTTVQQMEHTVLYMANFSPTDIMKDAGINRATHLIWSVENYVIRSQSAYDRLLILTDRLFHIHNASNRISHESIVSNAHIKRSNIPAVLKHVKKAVKNYYRDRNKIIHESSFADDELRHIEGLALLASDPIYGLENEDNLKKDLSFQVRRYVNNKKKEFEKSNKGLCLALGIVFNEMNPIFKKKYSELGAK